MAEKLKRRLTTVLCADASGYTRMMGEDEPGTLDMLRRHRATMAERHDGRVVNTWGDAVIAEFQSVVQAVQCAVEIQQDLSSRDVQRPEAQRMRFRIGINLGDVLVDGSDIYGDGVNIAARLQDLAEPGGILVSGPVFDQVHRKLALGFERLGTRQVKDLEAPITSYRVMHSADRPPGIQPAGTHAASGRGADDLSELGRAGEVDPTPAHQASWLKSAIGRMAALPQRIRMAIVLSGFLFLINLFSGMSRVWFQWPVLAITFIAIAPSLFRSRRRLPRK